MFIKTSALAFAAVLALAPLGAMAEDGDEPISVEREGGLFTISITEATPVEDVLDLIAEETGSDLKGEEDTGEIGPLKLVRVGLHQALREILQKRAFSMKFDEGSDDPSLIVIAATKTQVAAATDGETQPEPPQGQPKKLGLFRPKGDAGATPGSNPLEALLAKNPQFAKIKECSALLKLPQNRGKKSETLVTAEGDACPPGIRIFNQ
jgi:hypothetical protein